jgi:hypothetical protein
VPGTIRDYKTLSSFDRKNNNLCFAGKFASVCHLRIGLFLSHFVWHKIKFWAVSFPPTLVGGTFPALLSRLSEAALP